MREPALAGLDLIPRAGTDHDKKRNDIRIIVRNCDQPQPVREVLLDVLIRKHFACGQKVANGKGYNCAEFEKSDHVRREESLLTLSRPNYGCRVTFWTRQLSTSPTRSSLGLRQSIWFTVPNCFGSLPASPNLPRILPSSS